MNIHKSVYEKRGWISIEKELPKKQFKVKLANIQIVDLDMNIENLNWETTGWITSGGNWSVKLCNNFKVGDKPTHWMKL